MRLQHAEYPRPAVRSIKERLRRYSGQVGLTVGLRRRKVCEASAGVRDASDYRSVAADPGGIHWPTRCSDRCVLARDASNPGL